MVERVENMEKSNIWEEFPSFLPAMVVKELRMGLRTNLFVIVMVALPILMAIPFLGACLNGIRGAVFFTSAGVLSFYWTVTVIVFVFLLPLRGLGGIYKEVKNHSMEFLLLSPLSSYRIVIEKWLSLVLQSVLLWMMILPFLLLSYFMGGVDIILQLILLTLVLATSWLLTAVCLWISGMPTVMRVLSIIGMVMYVLQFIIGVIPFLLIRSVSGSGASFAAFPLLENDLMSRYDVYFFIIVVLVGVSFGLLNLAARTIAAPAENLSINFRKILIGMLLAAAGYALFLSLVDDNPVAPIVIVGSSVITGFLTLWILDVILPYKTLPIHVEALNNEPGVQGWWNRKLRLLLMPGWEGAALVGLFGVLSVAGLLLYLLESDLAGKEEYVVGIALAVWASVMAPIFVSERLFVITKYYSLLIYWAIIGIISTASGICYAIDNDGVAAGLLPVGAVANLIIGAGKGSFDLSPWLFIAVSLLVYMIYLSFYIRRCYRSK